MKRIRVNVLSVVNSASNITTETIDGKPHIVVRGITPVVDDIVMNRKLYPAAEIEKAFNTLERNPMPLGHPKVDGKHVSARDVRAVNNYHVGAWLQNVSSMYRVGEGGKPEIFKASNGSQYMIPGDNGSVISNRDIGGGSGAGGGMIQQINHFTIQSPSGDQQELVTQIAKISYEQSLRAMRDQQRPGGMLRK